VSHAERHRLLHQALVELATDYAAHHPGVVTASMTVRELCEWSQSQCQSPEQLPPNRGRRLRLEGKPLLAELLGEIAGLADRIEAAGHGLGATPRWRIVERLRAMLPAEQCPRCGLSKWTRRDN
jgi:hypothetical protein